VKPWRRRWRSEGKGEAGPYQDGFGYDWPTLPELFTDEELRAKPTRRRSCQTCKPDPVGKSV
jgi:hypothetical protein